MRRIAAAIVCGLAVAAIAAPIAAPAPPPGFKKATPAANPTLTASCGLRAILILDASNSIRTSSGTADVRNAAQAFVNALSGTGAQVAMFDFALRSRVNVDVPFTAVTAGTLTSVFNPAIARYDPLTQAPDRYTNWDVALATAGAVSDAAIERADAVVFLTDGDPTAAAANHGAADEVTNQKPENTADIGFADRQDDNPQWVSNAVEHANDLKKDGTHMYAFGVGTGVNNAGSKGRLQDVSGKQELKSSIAIGKVDWAVVPDFNKLAATFAQLATGLCQSSVRVTKKVDEDGNGSFDDPAGGWTFTGDVKMSSKSYRWLQPAGDGAPGPRPVTVSNDNPTAMFQWEPENASGTATFTFSEGGRAGYRLVDVDCGRAVTVSKGEYKFTLSAGQSASCTVRNLRLKAVTFCHATGDRDDPYTLRTVFLDDAGLATLGEHLKHTGSVFPTSGWGDIIPPYEGNAAGLNWTPVGQVVWQNTCTIPPVVKQVQPLARCVEALDDGTFRAHFGYSNPSDTPLELRAGSEWNRFSPAPADRGQVSLLTPDTTIDDVVQVDFAPDQQVTWTLGTQTATASASTRRCLGTITIVKRVNPANDGRFNLRVDGEIAGTGRLVGDNGTTGTVDVPAVPAGTVHTIDETAGPGTRLSRYDTSAVCRDEKSTVVAESDDSGTLPVTVHEGDAILCTITNTRHEERIVPVLECVSFNAAGPDIAVWGYDNPNDFPVDLPVADGGRNVFTPGTAGRGQPTSFGPGRQRDVLEVPFESDNGGTLTWRIDVPVTANASSEPCPTILPLPPEPPIPTPTPTPPPAPPAPPAAPGVDLAVTKIATPAVVSVGSRVAWLVTVTNVSATAAPDVTAYKLEERLPGTSTVISVTPSQGTCDSVGCHLGTLEPGATATIAVTTEEAETRVVVNTVRVSTSASETDLTNNTASALVRVIGAESATASQRCRALTAIPGSVTAGRTSVVLVRALGTGGRRIAGLRLAIRGAGVASRATTQADGTVRLAFTPRERGVISVAPTGVTARPGVPRECAILLGARAARPPSGVTG